METLLKECDVISKALQEYAVEKAKIQNQYSTIKNVPYNWYKIQEEVSIKWMPYYQFLTEHSRELANGINSFGRHINSLQVWEKVLNEFNDKEKHFIVIEFVAPLATLCLTLPYTLRSWFIYSVAHLCHQANRLKQKPWIDNLPLDKEIYFNEADKRGRYWGKEYNKLKKAIEKISNKQYEKATYDFRNKYNHRYSLRIEIGQTEFLKRNVNDKGKVYYTIVYTKPLTLNYIIPILKEQHSFCISAFKKYQLLVEKQLSMIDSHITTLS